MSLEQEEGISSTIVREGMYPVIGVGVYGKRKKFKAKSSTLGWCHLHVSKTLILQTPEIPVLKQQPSFSMSLPRKKLQLPHETLRQWSS